MSAHLTAAEVAAQLKVPVSHVERAARRGLINSRKIGRSVRFTQDDVDTYSAAQMRVAADPFARSSRQTAALRRRAS